MLLLAAVALGLPHQAPASATGRVPAPWLLGIGALLATSAFKMAPAEQLPPAGSVALVLVLAGVSIVAILTWSRRADWSDAHRLALAGGALLTYAWTAFPQQPVLPTDPTVDLVGNAIFALGAVVLLVVAWRHLPAREPAASRQPSLAPSNA